MKNKLLSNITPGEILDKEFLKPMDITQYRLAKDIGVPPRRINEIVKGLRAITADTALRLGKYFGTTPEFAAASKALAANQGLYNGFLAAGLVWGLWLGGSGTAVKIFFLCCVVIAGVYGAYTVNRRILFVQAAPAALTLGLLLMS